MRGTLGPMHSATPKRPGWFVAALLALTLWALAGVASWAAHVWIGDRLAAEQGPWDLAFYRALPAWFAWDYALATWSALGGVIALWLRSRHAMALYLLSLAGVVVQFGYVFAMTDLLAHKGPAATVPFPLFIAVMGVVQILLARVAAKRGWVG